MDTRNMWNIVEALSEEIDITVHMVTEVNRPVQGTMFKIIKFLPGREKIEGVVSVDPQQARRFKEKGEDAYAVHAERRLRQMKEKLTERFPKNGPAGHHLILYAHDGIEAKCLECGMEYHHDGGWVKEIEDMMYSDMLDDEIPITVPEEKNIVKNDEYVEVTEDDLKKRRELAMKWVIGYYCNFDCEMTQQRRFGTPQL